MEEEDDDGELDDTYNLDDEICAEHLGRAHLGCLLLPKRNDIMEHMSYSYV